MTLQLIEGTDEYRIAGLAMKVWRELGFSMLESVYERALMMELKREGFSAERQIPVDVYYDGEKLNHGYAADIIVENRIVLELKAVTRLYAIHRRQIQFYLSASGIESGLLINFGNAKKLECERFERIKSGCRLSGVPQIPDVPYQKREILAAASGSLAERVRQVFGTDAEAGGNA